VAAITILGAVHSIYRGTIGDLINNTERIPHIEKKVEEVEDKQEDMSDAIVLLTHAQSNDQIDPDPKAVESDLRDEDEGPSRYARGGHLYENGASEVEDEARDPGAHNNLAKDTVDQPERDEP